MSSRSRTARSPCCRTCPTRATTRTTSPRTRRTRRKACSRSRTAARRRCTDATSTTRFSTWFVSCARAGDEGLQCVQALDINPAFNLYRIFDVVRRSSPPLWSSLTPTQYPVLWDVLGFPGSFPATQGPIYFDRTDVKRAIHAPLNVTWAECAEGNVFARRGGDASPPTSLSVLPNVIEKSVRSVIVNGLADFCIMAGGTRIAIQKYVPHLSLPHAHISDIFH
jgi:hypothetical protein